MLTHDNINPFYPSSICKRIFLGTSCPVDLLNIDSTSNMLKCTTNLQRPFPPDLVWQQDHLRRTVAIESSFWQAIVRFG